MSDLWTPFPRSAERDGRKKPDLLTVIHFQIALQLNSAELSQEFNR